MFSTTTRRVSLVEHELLTLLEHLSSPPDISGVRVARSLVLCTVFCKSVVALLSFFFLLLYYLYFFDLRLLITPWYCLSVFDFRLLITPWYCLSVFDLRLLITPWYCLSVFDFRLLITPLVLSVCL